jgi:hypothetical protein
MRCDTRTEFVLLADSTCTFYVNKHDSTLVRKADPSERLGHAEDFPTNDEPSVDLQLIELLYMLPLLPEETQNCPDPDDEGD